MTSTKMGNYTMPRKIMVHSNKHAQDHRVITIVHTLKGLQSLLPTSVEMRAFDILRDRFEGRQVTPLRANLSHTDDHMCAAMMCSANIAQLKWGNTTFNRQAGKWSISQPLQWIEWVRVAQHTMLSLRQCTCPMFLSIQSTTLYHTTVGSSMCFVGCIMSHENKAMQNAAILHGTMITYK